LIDAQLAEAQGRTADALAGYLAAIEQELPPAVRGTAAVGAARCLAALDRVAEAAELVDRAGPLLARWGGWRVAELAQVRERLGATRRPSRGSAGHRLCGGAPGRTSPHPQPSITDGCRRIDPRKPGVVGSRAAFTFLFVVQVLERM